MLQIEHLAKDLPTLNNMLLKLEEGNLSVKLKHESISEIMNQLSISLILSALIIGSSLAIMSDKGPKIFDVSILGLIGFVFSAALGIYLVIQFMLKRKITYTKKPFNITNFLIYFNRKLKSFSKSFIRNLCILLHSQL